MAYRSKPFSIRLPPTLLEQVDQRAAEKGMTRTQWIQQALIFALSHKGIKITETKEYRA